MLRYKVEKRGKSLFIKLTEIGSSRILYLDTLKKLARDQDKKALDFLIKIHLKTTRNPETLTFDRIEVPPPLVQEALALMRETGRMEGDVEEPVLAPLKPLPQLQLSDASGSFARLLIDYGIGVVDFTDFSPTILGRRRLQKEEGAFESDLIEAGYIKKGEVYFCPQDKVKEALTLLLDVGWQMFDPLGNPVSKGIQIKEENGKIAIRASIRALVDHKLQMQGVWEGETLYLKRREINSILPLLDAANIDWEKKLFECAQGLKMGATLTLAPPGLKFRGTLFPYQQKGVDWLAFLYRWGFSALLADEMGLGKTVQVLAFLSRLEKNLPVLVVAPTSLLFNWRLEIDRFLPGRDIELISYGSLRGEAIQKTFEVIVLDESNAIKNRTTQTAKAAFQLKGNFRISITGTPMENSSEELRSQFHFLMPHLFEKSAELVQNEVRPFMLRRKKEEVQPDLPEKIEQLTWIEMGDEQRDLYETYRKGLKVDSMSQMQVLEAILRLRQISVDPRLVGSSLVGAKIEQLLSDLNEALQEKRKILIFSQFTSLLKNLQKEFPNALYLDGEMSGMKRGEQVQTFQNDPNASLFLLSLKAGGVGLNLTAADTVFILDPWWNEAVEKQAIDRAHRIGQKKTVFAKRYLTLGTVEEKMLRLKEEKLKAIDQLLDSDSTPFSEGELFSLLS